MYISTDLLIKIGVIAWVVFNVIFNIFVWLKLRKLKANTNIADIIKKAKEIGGKVLEAVEPAFPNIIGLIRAITGGEKPKDKENEED